MNLEETHYLNQQDRVYLMKRIIISIFIIHLCVLSFADSFTDAIQDLAFAIACKGTYAGAEAGSIRQKER